MRPPTLKFLLVINFFWALTASSLYLHLRSNPRVIALPLEPSSGIHSQSLADIEVNNFLRQFLEQYLNYSSQTFWQSQMNLTQLMTRSLAESRIHEIQKSKEKIHSKNISQKGTILKITELAKNKYRSEVKVSLNENSQTKNILFLNLMIELIPSDRTMENPWALLVSDIQIQSSTSQEPSFLKQLQTRIGRTSFLTLPCAIENIENPDDKNLKIKITTMNISEIQLSTSSKILPTKLIASCREQEFQFDLKSDSQEHTLFLNFPVLAGQSRSNKNQLGAKKEKDIYDKTIEKVLGVKLDN